MCPKPCNSPRSRALASRFSPSRFRKEALWNCNNLYGFHYHWFWIPKIEGHPKRFCVISECGVKTRVPSVLPYHGTFGTDGTRVFSPYSFFHCHVHTSILYWTKATGLSSCFRSTMVMSDFWKTTPILWQSKMKKPDTGAYGCKNNCFHGMKLPDSCHRIFNCQDTVFPFTWAAWLTLLIHLPVFSPSLASQRIEPFVRRASKFALKTFSQIAIFDPIFQPVSWK